MKEFLKKVTDWMIDKEEDMAKKCAIPMKEVDYQIEKVQAQKQKVQSEYDDAIEELDHILAKLQKIKDIEILRCREE